MKKLTKKLAMFLMTLTLVVGIGLGLSACSVTISTNDDDKEQQTTITQPTNPDKNNNESGNGSGISNEENNENGSNTEGGNVDCDVITYKYKDTPTLELVKNGKKVTGTITLSVACIEKYNGSTKMNYDTSNLTFVDFTFLEPSNFLGESAEGAGWRCTVKKRIDNDRGLLTVEWTYQDDALGDEDVAYQCPCMVRNGSDYYLTVTASYKSKGGSDLPKPVKFEVKLSGSSGIEFTGMEA